MDKTEGRILEIIEEKKDDIIAFGRDIWEHAELGYREKRTAEKFSEVLRECKVDELEEQIAITGVKGKIKADNPKASIALMGEMDALSLPYHPNVNKMTGAAHACGHNAQITAVAGAAMALCDPKIRKCLDGDVSFIGVPAEESISAAYFKKIKEEGLIEYSGGKCEFLTKGKLRDIELIMGHHIAGQNNISVSFGSCNGFVNKNVTFHGKSAHSFGAGYLGIDAMAAANVAQHALELQRETFRDKDCVKIHGFISEAGKANNVIADKVSMEYTVRAASLSAIYDASAKFDRAMKAGAMSVGSGLTIETTPGYLPIHVLKDKEAMIEAVREISDVTGYRASIDRNYSHGGGSTDYGDITAVMPLLFFETGGFEGAGHSNEYRPVDEYLAYVVPSMVFALTAYKLLRDKAKAARRVIDAYDPPMTQEGYMAWLKESKSLENVDQKPLPVLED